MACTYILWKVVTNLFWSGCQFGPCWWCLHGQIVDGVRFIVAGHQRQTSICHVGRVKVAVDVVGFRVSNIWGNFNVLGKSGDLCFDMSEGVGWSHLGGHADDVSGNHLPSGLACHGAWPKFCCLTAWSGHVVWCIPRGGDRVWGMSGLCKRVRASA